MRISAPVLAKQHGRPGSHKSDVIAAVVKWSESFIEQPHEIFGGLPVCPFARAARLKETIRFEVRSFDMHLNRLPGTVRRGDAPDHERLHD